MVERAFFVHNKENTDLEAITNHLNEGWELDPLFNSKPIRLENEIVYHMIKYTSEEKQALEQEEPQPEVESVKSVSYDEVDSLISNGYQPKDYYAKSVVMVKMKSQEENTV